MMAVAVIFNFIVIAIILMLVGYLLYLMVLSTIKTIKAEMRIKKERERFYKLLDEINNSKIWRGKI